MRFLIIPKPDPRVPPRPADAPPDDALFKRYMKFNEDLLEAGVLVASEGLNPAGLGGRIELVDGKRTPVDGPYAEAKELVGGFWVISVATRQEAIDWACRAPLGFGGDEILELHEMTDIDTLPPNFQTLMKEAAPKWYAATTRNR